MEEELVINSEHVGEPWPEVKRTVTWHQTTDYAAVIGDMNPIYVDDEREEGIIAPPMFAVTCGWFVRKDFDKYSIKPIDEKILNKEVHYTQYIEHYKPIRPGISEKGIELTIRPSIHAMIPQRAGTHMIYRYEVLDESGDVCHVEYCGTMIRGVSCSDGGSGQIPSVPAPKSQDNVIWEKSIHISRAMIYIYDMSNGGGAAIHSSKRFAHSVGLPDQLVQGAQTIAIAIRELTYLVADGDGSRLQIQAAKFKGMVFADSDIRIQLFEKNEKEESIELFFQVVDQNDRVVISKGYLKFRK